MHPETEAIWCCSALLERLIVYGEPAGTRTQGPRLKRAIQTITTEDARLRPIDTIPLKSCNISFLPL